MNPLNNRIIEFESKVLTTLLFDGSYVLHVVRHGHPCHLYPHVSLLHEGSFELFKKDLPIAIHSMEKYFAFIFLLLPQLLLAQTGGAGAPASFLDSFFLLSCLSRLS